MVIDVRSIAESDEDDDDEEDEEGDDKDGDRQSDWHKNYCARR